MSSSVGSGTNRKDCPRGLHKIKKLLHNKRNSLSIEEATNRMGGVFASNTSDTKLITRVYRELKKIKLPQNQ
jgi:hypothetical protein